MMSATSPRAAGGGAACGEQQRAATEQQWEAVTLHHSYRLETARGDAPSWCTHARRRILFLRRRVRGWPKRHVLENSTHRG